MQSALAIWEVGLYACDEYVCKSFPNSSLSVFAVNSLNFAKLQQYLFVSTQLSLPPHEP